MWTIIPLTSKHKGDTYYFHYDLEIENIGTARIENLISVSVNRIKEPYYIKNRIETITKKDNDILLKIIKKYYAFEDVNIRNLSKTEFADSKKNREKVLT